MTEQAGEVRPGGERVVVAGGGVGGLALALMLGRAGRPVTLVERDDLDGEADPEEAFAGTRRGVPQTHQTHGFLARLRLELRDRLPDVLAEVEAAGAHTLPLSPDLGERMPGDEDLAVLIVRRTTVEWVLRRAVAAEPGITLRTGETVAGLVVADGQQGQQPTGSGGHVPHVVGARLASGEVLPGTVVACTGSRGDVPAWLAELGVEVAEEEHQTKLIYLTRWYRLPPGRTPDDLGGRLFGDLGYLRYLVVPCDGRTLSATLAVDVKDRELRAQLLDDERFDKAVRRLPGPDQFFADGGDGGVEPLGPVRPMAGLVNRLRRFVDDGQQPLVTGFHAVGDAHTCTNPLYGRGCALAMVQAGLLADAFAAHGDDALARAAEYEAGSVREVEPWFHGSVQMDQLRDKVEARAARRRAAREAAAEPEAATADEVVVAPDEATEEAVVAGAAVGRALAASKPNGSEAAASADTAAAAAAEDEAATAAATFGRIMVEGGTDPVVGRAIVRLFNLLTLPQDLMSDPELLARVAPLLAKPPQPLPEPEGPTLEELLA
jgi:2-polyprenyl-6-methoxyphenol hydroxylase-like FAD-dependent oxidoreductase